MKTLIRNLFTASLLLVSLPALAAADIDEFARNFCDSTLRLDYIAGGNADESRVFLQRQKKFKGWAGRRHNLRRAPYTGGGTITVTDSVSGDTIYRHSFSLLFNEWKSTPEARKTSRAFEATMLVPLPRRAAKVTVELLDSRMRPVATNSHCYSPADILVDESVSKHPAEVIPLHTGGDPKQAIDIVILAEGYTEAEKDSFLADARKAVDAIFAHEPFGSRRDDFNFKAVWTPSADNGMSVPRNDDWKETAFGSHYDTFYSERYLTTPNVFDIHDALAHVPYEHIIILANSPVYGGGGIYNSYTLTTSKNDNFEQVVVHEFGHSFGGLGDEYFYENDVMSDSYPTDVEPWEPNLTTLVDFDSKWKPLLKKGTPVPTPADKAAKYPVGVYEGGGYSFKGVYRPADVCRMRNNTTPAFCDACQWILSRLIDFYTR